MRRYFKKFLQALRNRAGTQEVIRSFRMAASGKLDHTELARVNVVSRKLYDEKQREHRRVGGITQLRR